MNIILSKRLELKNAKLYVLIVTVILVAYIIAECFFRPFFEAYSDEIVIEDQKKYTQNLYKLLSFITSMGYGLAISIISIFYYEISKNKLKAIIMILLTTYLNYFLSIIKMLYHQPRPYMRNPDVTYYYKCGEEWGNPSGHALIGFTFYFIVFNSLRKRLLEIRFSEEKDSNKSRDLSVSPQVVRGSPQEMEMREIHNMNDIKEININNAKSKETLPNEGDQKICEKCKKNIVKKRVDEELSLCEPCIHGCFGKDSIKTCSHPSSPGKLSGFHIFASLLCYAVFLALVALIGYSRFFFGLHSINQILLGWIYAYVYLVYFYYVFTGKAAIERILSFFESVSKYSNKALRFKMGIMLLVILILTFLIPWIIYYNMERDIPINPEFYENMKKKCPESVFDKPLFYANCFSDIGSISIIFGILFGILAASGNYVHEEFWPNYWELPHWKKALRMILLGGLAGGIFGIWSGIKFPTDPYSGCFLDNGLKGFILGFLMVTLLPKVYLKLKLDVKGDFMREKSE